MYVERAQLLYLLLTVLGDTARGHPLPRITPGFLVSPVGEVYMRPVKRSYVNKGRSARKFNGDTARTKAANLRPPAMRGGFRL